MVLEFSQQVFEKKKHSNIEFRENRSTESRCYMRKDKQTDMAKLIVTSRNFESAPENYNVNKSWDRTFSLMFHGTALTDYLLYILVFSACLTDDEFDRERKYVATFSLSEQFVSSGYWF